MVVDGGTVRLIGELDPTGVEAATAALASVEGDVTVDCSALTFLDAAGLEVLAGAHRTCQAAGVDLIVVDPAPCVTRLLALTRLDRHLAIRWSSQERR